MSNARELSQIATAIVVDGSKNVSVAEKITVTKDSSISGLTVGKGGGSSSQNTAVGASALAANTTGFSNVAIGYRSLFANTTGDSNTAVGSRTDGIGAGALEKNTTGSRQTSIGGVSLSENTTGTQNTAVGYGASANNTTGSYNTSLGTQSLSTSTTGANNTALGYQSLYGNTTASNNTAVGYQAGYSTTTGGGVGGQNVFVGTQAGSNVVAFSRNTCVGYQAGNGTTTADRVTAIGHAAGNINTGGFNCFVGGASGLNNTSGTNNNFFGDSSGYLVTTGSKNTIIGGYGGNQGGLDIRTASNYIVLSDGDGNPRGFINAAGTAKFSSTGNWRNTSAALYEMNINNSNEIILELSNEASSNPYGQRTRFTAASPNNTTQYFYQAVDSTTSCFTIWSNGTTSGRSDERLKKNIEDASPKLEDICKLQVRNYEWKESDGGTKEIGLIAQEVEQVFPNLVVTHDLEKQGDDYKEVKYSVFVPMLIKAVQELKAEVDSLKQQLGK